MRFTDKTAIITGGAQGIGEVIARLMAAEGAAVVISDLNVEAGQKVSQEINSSNAGQASFVKTDVKNPDDIKQLVEHAQQKFGTVDILVNSAGICINTGILDISVEEWDHMMNVNLRGMFLCCQMVAPLMIKQKSGKIVSMASLAGKVGGIAAGAHYSASKAGVICVTKSFAKALGPHGINVNAIAPGPVETAMIGDWPPDVKKSMADSAPLGRLAKPRDIAEAALFLASEAARHITGETININGGILMD